MLNQSATQCKAKSKRSGKQCQNPAISGSDVCRMHGANPKNHGGAPRENKNAMTYGIFSNDLQDDEERQIYQEYYQALQGDFEMNDSADRMTCQMACIFFIRLRRAVLCGKNSDIALVESLVRNQLKELKTAAGKGDKDSSKISPAEWVANLIKEVEETRAAKAERKQKRQKKKKSAPVTKGNKTA